jgi:hypothetical protein
MYGRPNHPCWEPVHVNSSALQHGKSFANDSHASFVEITKWFGSGPSDKPIVNQFTRIAALLNRYLCHAGKRFAILIE